MMAGHSAGHSEHLQSGAFHSQHVSVGSSYAQSAHSPPWLGAEHGAEQLQTVAPALPGAATGRPLSPSERGCATRRPARCEDTVRRGRRKEEKQKTTIEVELSRIRDGVSLEEREKEVEPEVGRDTAVAALYRCQVTL